MKQKFQSFLKRRETSIDRNVVDLVKGQDSRGNDCLNIVARCCILPQVLFPVVLAFCEEYGFHFYVDVHEDTPFVHIYKVFEP